MIKKRKILIVALLISLAITGCGKDKDEPAHKDVVVEEHPVTTDEKENNK